MLTALMRGALIGVVALIQLKLPAPIPVEPVSGILDGFKTHSLVALSEPHGNEQAHALRLKLIRDPRFPSLVDDIVMEAGNARYQNLIDRFINGESVSDSELRHVWQDIVSPGPTGDLPIYEDFYRAVRALNQGLPKQRRLRVLLADPPIDWSQVRSGDDLVKWGLQRDVHTADVIMREVVAKKRRALLIFGEGHLWRRNPRSNFDRDDLPGPFVGILARAGAPRVFTISTAPVDIMDLSKLIDVQAWPVPGFALLHGTTLGGMDFAAFAPASGRYVMRDGKRIDIPREQWRVIPMEEQFDALLYLGPRSGFSQSRISAALCADPSYLPMRLARMALVGQPSDALKQHCASFQR